MTLEEKIKEIVSNSTSLSDDEWVKKYGDIPYWDLILAACSEWVDGIIQEKKSVDELHYIMGEAYRDLSVQVAFKEGYNKAIDKMRQRKAQTLQRKETVDIGEKERNKLSEDWWNDQVKKIYEK